MGHRNALPGVVAGKFNDEFAEPFGGQVEAGVEVGRWAWSSVFVDLNNDGWEDLVVANGFVTGPDTTDL